MPSSRTGSAARSFQPTVQSTVQQALGSINRTVLDAVQTYNNSLL